MVVTKPKGKLVKGNKENTISAEARGRSTGEFQVYTARLSLKQQTERGKGRRKGEKSVSRSDG